MSTAIFVIDAEFLVDHARLLMLSDRASDAWRFLAQNLVGDSNVIESAAREILDGTKRLAGDSRRGIEIVDDDATEYKQQLAYTYAGRFRIGTAWYVPDSTVVRFGADDALAASHFLRSDADHPRQALRDFARARVAYYAREGQRVVEVHGHPGVIICSPCGELPFWWRDEPSDATDALCRFLSAGRRLREFSASSDSGGRIVSARLDRADAEQEREETERADERAEQFASRCREIGSTVRARAGDDVFELTTESGRKFRVPRAPFTVWALRRTSLQHLAPTWAPVAPSGMKLQMDDPYHTDWMLGAGMDLATDYSDQEITSAAWDAVFRIQEELGAFEAAVITGSREIDGVVGQNVLVLRDLHPDHLPEALRAEAIVTEQGGALAHLAQVAMEHGIVIMRLPDARKRLPNGSHVTLTPATGSVHIRPR